MNEYPQDTGRGNSQMMSFVIGAAVGAGIALLFAPDSGVETRRRLGRTANRLRTNLGDGVGIAKERVGELSTVAKDRVGEFSSEVKGRLGELREDVTHAVQTGREAFARDREARQVKP